MSGGKKRGPKGPRFDDTKALLVMAPLVRKKMSVLSAATYVVRQGLAAIEKTETATITRVRKGFQRDREKLMTRRPRSGPVYPTINLSLKSARTLRDLYGGVTLANQLEPLQVKALIEMIEPTKYGRIASQAAVLASQSITEQTLAATARYNPVDLHLFGTEVNRMLATLPATAEDALRAMGLSSNLADEIMSKARDKLRPNPDLK